MLSSWGTKHIVISLTLPQVIPCRSYSHHTLVLPNSYVFKQIFLLLYKIMSSDKK